MEMTDLLALLGYNDSTLFSNYHNFKITPHSFDDRPSTDLGSILTFVFERKSGFENKISKT